MPDLKKQTPRQRAQMTYMMDVMRRLEWDLHNTIELTGRIPEAWHEIATATPRAAKVTGGAWEDEGPPVVEAVRARVQEAAQKAVAEWEERVFGGPLVR